MKKFITAVIVALIAAIAAPGVMALDPDACGKPRGRFTNIGFVYNKMSQEGYPTIHSDIGISLTKGTTYYLHKPIAGCLRFGIDASWFDINYANYKVKEHFADEINEFSIHQVDLGLQVGVSATLNLFKRFQASGYFRYNPSLAMMYNNDELQAGFANMMVGGVSVGYGVIGLGVEARFGRPNIKSYFAQDGGDDEGDSNWSDYVGSRKVSTKCSAVRAYISFRF